MYLDKVLSTFALFEISKIIPGLVFASHPNFIFIKAKLTKFSDKKDLIYPARIEALINVRHLVKIVHASSSNYAWFLPVSSHPDRSRVVFDWIFQSSVSA